MAIQHEQGKKGEELAARHLLKKGYKILQKNWRFGREEIDLIASNGPFICFVEVKTRVNSNFGDPASFVSLAKQKRIIRTAAAYIDANEMDLEVRFDIISILLGKGQTTIEHLEEAFQPRW